MTSKADTETNRVAVEPILDPELPIVDAHHHLWFQTKLKLAAMESGESISQKMLLPLFRRCARYLFDEFLTDVNSGHNVVASVFVDANAMYRETGPDHLRPVGEVEFANGAAAMAASGTFGQTKICAGIVGRVDLARGEASREVLLAQIAAGGGRYRGVRSFIVRDEDPEILGANNAPRGRLKDPKFRAGFAELERLGLSFDAWVFEPQLPEVIDLAHAFPNTQIVLNHVGAPLGVGRYAGQREARLPIWRENIRRLADCGNVAVKLGGLGIPFGGSTSYLAQPPRRSDQLAHEWKPYIEHCVDAFGVERCMFESNFPVDSAVGSYATVWNAFKRLCSGASEGEKAALFHKTAARIYRLDL